MKVTSRHYGPLAQSPVHWRRISSPPHPEQQGVKAGEFHSKPMWKTNRKFLEGHFYWTVEATNPSVPATFGLACFLVKQHWKTCRRNKWQPKDPGSMDFHLNPQERQVLYLVDSRAIFPASTNKGYSNKYSTNPNMIPRKSTKRSQASTLQIVWVPTCSTKKGVTPIFRSTSVVAGCGISMKHHETPTSNSSGWEDRGFHILLASCWKSCIGVRVLQEEDDQMTQEALRR